VYSTKSGAFTFLATLVGKRFLSHEYLASYARDVLRNGSVIVNRFYPKLNAPTDIITSSKCHCHDTVSLELLQTDGRDEAHRTMFIIFFSETWCVRYLHRGLHVKVKMKSEL
jgi:hypothetical protein